MEESRRVHIAAEMIQDEKEGNGIEDLRKRIEEKEIEAKENYDRLLRMAADFDNYKKRAAREKEELTRFANEELIKAILPFIDHLEKALEQSEKTRDIRSLVEGVKLTCDQVLRTLKTFGLSPVQSIGSPFDPAVHEAMLVAEMDQVEPNQVVEEFRKGYLLHDRLIRPAMVSVSKPRDDHENDPLH